MSRYAGLVSRVAALAVDVCVLAVGVSLVVTGLPAVWATIAGAPPGWLSAGAGLLGALIPVLYFAGCWWLTGQTLGGLLLGTVVRRPDGAALGAARSLLRAVLGLLIPILWIIGLVNVLLDPRRRALHDRVFGTVVEYRTHTQQ